MRGITIRFNNNNISNNVFKEDQKRKHNGFVDSPFEVLDARDPMGTRSSHIESFMRKEKQHKHLIFVLNKCDLVPTWVMVGMSL